MVSSLAKELSRLNAPAPRSIDPENEDFGADASSRKSSKSSLHLEEESSNKAAYQDAKQGHLLRTIGDLDFDGKYKGKKSSRKELGYGSLSDDDSGANFSDSFSGTDSETDVELHEKEEPSADNKNVNRIISATNSQSADVDKNVAEVDHSDDEEGSFSIKAPEKVRPNRVQGKHAKTQVDIWSKIVGFRIRMQPLLSSAIRFPDQESRVIFEKNNSVSTGFSKVSNSLCNILRDLLSIREKAIAQNNRFLTEPPTQLGKKRSRQCFEAKKLDLDRAWTSLDADNKFVSDFYESSFNQWHQRSKLASGLSGKKLKAVDQSITEQVQQVLDSDNNGRISMRTQIIPAGVTLFGQSFSSEGNTGPRYHPEVYNDSSFYQQLLKDFVLTSGLDSARKHGGDVVLKSKKLVKKKNANVDVKASKGRRIRYTVHDKLVSFVAPQPVPMSQVDRDQLLRSLFS